jgi:hypothetical protein
MLDVGGQDSTEAFEDVGHSDEAREILDGLLVGTLKRQVNISLPYTYTYTLTISRFSKHVYNIHATTVRPSAVPSSGPSPQNTSPAISHPFTPAKHTPYLAPRIWASEPFRPHSNPYHTHTHTPKSHPTPSPQSIPEDRERKQADTSKTGGRPQAQELRTVRRHRLDHRRRLDRRRPVRHHPDRRRPGLRRLQVPAGAERAAVDPPPFYGQLQTQAEREGAAIRLASGQRRSVRSARGYGL